MASINVINQSADEMEPYWKVANCFFHASLTECLPNLIVILYTVKRVQI